MSKTARKKLKAPFPYFGGKRRVAPLVWPRIGDVANLIIPFFGSGGEFWGGLPWLFERPHAHRIVTINDADCYVANFWRAIQAEPTSVAEHADWPVNEADLHSRHRWLVLSQSSAEFRERMRREPEYYDTKIAGWWCWGICCWIGAGWCSAAHRNFQNEAPINLGPDGKNNGVNRPLVEQIPDISGDDGASGRGVHARSNSALWNQRPDLGGWNGDGTGGNGVHASAVLRNKRPGSSGNGYSAGIHAKRPSLGDAKSGDGQKGVNSGLSQKKPRLNAGGNAADTPGRGIHGLNDQSRGTCEQRRAWIVGWFRDLADHLRTIRVCCGDWQRVCDSSSVTNRLGLTGLFLDPPYSLDVGRMHAWVQCLQGNGPEPELGKRADNRDGNLYATDSADDVDRLVARVHCYCLDRGADPLMRIALCGYEGEHDALEQHGWSVLAWRAHGGYGNRSSKGRANAGRERIWFSPGCIDTSVDDYPLFAEL